MHLRQLLLAGLVLCAAGSTLLVACGPAQTQAITASDDWRSRAVAASVMYFSDMCFEIAPLPIVDPDNPEYVECVRQSSAAEHREAERLYAAALARCVVDPKPPGCCFERQIGSKHRHDDWQSRCNDECVRITRRAQVFEEHMPPGCHPLVLVPPRSKTSRFYTEAVQRVERECASDQSAITKCASLASKWERILCEGKCSPLASDASEADAGTDPEGDDSMRPD